MTQEIILFLKTFKAKTVISNFNAFRTEGNCGTPCLVFGEIELETLELLALVAVLFFLAAVDEQRSARLHRFKYCLFYTKGKILTSVQSKTSSLKLARIVNC